MRKRAPLLAVTFLLLAARGHAAEGPEFKGLWISTPFPDRTISATAPAVLDLTIHNYDLPPQIVHLDVSHTPPGWKVVLLGDNKPIDAIAVGPNATADAKLQVMLPENAQQGSYSLTVTAQGEGTQSALPITLRIGQVLPAELALSVDLPDQQGTARSTFTYRVTVRNDSGSDALVNLEAQAPPDFQVAFKEAYGSKELTSVPVKAGESKDIDVSVSPPADAKAGTYGVSVAAISGPAKAVSHLKLAVEGRPQLTLSGPGGLLSSRAYAGRQTPMPLVLVNSGSASARGITLSSDPPPGWKVVFQPKNVDIVDSGANVKVTALVTPAAKALAGDYMVGFDANGNGSSSAAEYRVTVETSTLWGIAGVIVIAIALGVLGFSVRRYGRR